MPELLAPELTLTAVGSGRELRLRDPGVLTLLICFSQETQPGIGAVEAAVRERWPNPDDVLIGHIVDLHKVPGIFRKIAEGILANEHRRAVEALAPGRNAADCVVIFPDWDGSVVKALSLEDVTKTLGVVVIDRLGRITGSHEGSDSTAAAVDLLAASHA